MLGLFYTRMRRCFLSYDFISGQRLHNILPPEMKLHLCRNDRNEITPAMSFISGFFMQTVKRGWRETELKIEATLSNYENYKQHQTKAGKKSSKC